MSDPPVVVAGGGIAGLCAALALARSGRRVRVFERDAARSEEGAGLQMSPNATRHLREWGVLDGLAARALSPEAVVVRRARDAVVLARMDVRDAEARWGAPFRVAHRADLHAALRAAVGAQSRIEQHDGVAVTGYVESDALLVQRSDGLTHSAAALIAADGVRSSLRARFLPGGDGLAPSGRVAWRALVPADDVADFAREPASNLWLGPDAHLVHYPLRGGSVVNLVAVTDGDGGAGTDGFWSSAGDADALSRRFSRWHRSARDLVARAESWRVWPLLSRSVPDRLSRGTVALVGDAAHPMMPFLAQGAAQAIEDGAALAAAFRTLDDPVAALAAYSDSRRARVARVAAASRRQGTIYHLRGPAAAARDAAIRLLGSRGMAAATDWIYQG